MRLAITIILMLMPLMSVKKEQIKLYVEWPPTLNVPNACATLYTTTKPQVVNGYRYVLVDGTYYRLPR